MPDSLPGSEMRALRTSEVMVRESGQPEMAENPGGEPGAWAQPRGRTEAGGFP